MNTENIQYFIHLCNINVTAEPNANKLTFLTGTQLIWVSGPFFWRLKHDVHIVFERICNILLTLIVIIILLSYFSRRLNLIWRHKIIYYTSHVYQLFKCSDTDHDRINDDQLVLKRSVRTVKLVLFLKKYLKFCLMFQYKNTWLCYNNILLYISFLTRIINNCLL